MRFWNILNIVRYSINKYFFYFTYDNAVLRSIFDADGGEVFKKYNFEVKYLKDEKFLLRVL
jgi:hypothetical protein